MVLNTFLLTATGFAGAFVQSWWPMLPGIAVMVGLWLFFLHLRPLEALTPFHQSGVEKMVLLEVAAVVVATVAGQ